MKIIILRFAITALFGFYSGGALFSQGSFMDNQRSSIKIAEIFNRCEDSLKKRFEDKKISWPPKSIYIRAFKYNQLMEVWVKGANTKSYHLYKTDTICMQIGNTGPKRQQGDLQIPEGFYYIQEFNPNSNYHLSLGLNYPNVSDKIICDSLRPGGDPGGDIFIHGNCVSVGCLAINDYPIEELYILAAHARSNGQDFIPVHVFPVKFDEESSMEYLDKVTMEDKSLRKFEYTLKEAFDYFEEKKRLPVIMVNKKGEYIID